MSTGDLALWIPDLAVDHAIFRIHKGAMAIIHVEGQENPDIYNPIKYSSELRGG